MKERDSLVYFSWDITLWNGKKSKGKVPIYLGEKVKVEYIIDERNKKGGDLSFMSSATKATALTELLGRKCSVKLQNGYTFIDKLIAIETKEKGAFLIFEKAPIRYDLKEISSIKEIHER